VKLSCKSREKVLETCKACNTVSVCFAFRK